MQLAPEVVVAERFRLQRPLGQGGMGSVWIAQHMGLDIPCAIKFIEGTIAHDPEMRMRFEREAKAAAQLRSPNVVQIFDHGICEGTPYIAMELLVGEDLRHRLDRVTRLAPEVAVGLLEQVCRALTKAHGAGIVHRDLKPENIFLVRDDDVEIAKVLDFGIAKRQELGGEGASHTRTGAVMGSPYYMSPEQAQGARSLDRRSDLWSMAVIAYECLTGLKPFDSSGLGELILKICVSPLPVPSHTGYAGGAFDAWWARAACRDPAGRFQSARELSDSLGAALGVAPRGSTATNTGLQAAAAAARAAGAGGGAAGGAFGTGAAFGAPGAPGAYGGVAGAYGGPPGAAVAGQTASGAVATNPPYVAPAAGGRAWMGALAAVVLLAFVGTAALVLRARLSRAAMGGSEAPAGLVGHAAGAGGAGSAAGVGAADGGGAGSAAPMGVADGGGAGAAAVAGEAAGPGSGVEQEAAAGGGEVAHAAVSAPAAARPIGGDGGGAAGATSASGAAARGGGHGHGGGAPKGHGGSSQQIGF